MEMEWKNLKQKTEEYSSQTNNRSYDLWQFFKQLAEYQPKSTTNNFLQHLQQAESLQKVFLL